MTPHLVINYLVWRVSIYVTASKSAHRLTTARQLVWLFTVCGLCHFIQMLLFSAGAPRVSHPLLLLRDVLLCGWVAHPLSQLATAGLSCLEVGILHMRNPLLVHQNNSVCIIWHPNATNTRRKCSIIWLHMPRFYCDAGIWADLWWAVQDSTTQQPSWMLTSWRSVKKKAGANWLSTSCHSSTISTGTKLVFYRVSLLWASVFWLNVPKKYIPICTGLLCVIWGCPV